MPIFEYSCPACGHIFEELTSASDQSPKTCPCCAFPKAVKILSATRMGASGNSSPAFARAAASTPGCAPRNGFS
ncbi:MAG TPA: zinc ribbon domain-containing protein [Desulfonatronum sp.]|nr:zinc ribbon domain-containing protein [Desulfonatronum sp.]